jgi:hypothetical protein
MFILQLNHSIQHRKWRNTEHAEELDTVDLKAHNDSHSPTERCWTNSLTLLPSH